MVPEGQPLLLQLTVGTITRHSSAPSSCRNASSIASSLYVPMREAIAGGAFVPGSQYCERPRSWDAISGASVSGMPSPGPRISRVLRCPSFTRKIPGK